MSSTETSTVDNKNLATNGDTQTQLLNAKGGNVSDDGFDETDSDTDTSANSYQASNTDLGAGDLRAQPVGTEYVIFRLENTSRRGEVYIDGTIDCVNPKTGKKERARLLKGVAEIWMRDQKDLEKDYAVRNRRSLRFINKTCRIPSTDTAAIELARVHPGNIDGPNKGRGSKYQFVEWTAKRQEEKAKAKIDQQVKATLAANEVGEEYLRKHAIYLNVQLTDEIGELLTPKGLRANYLKYALEYPEKFLASLNSDEVEVSFLIKSAIRDSRIDINRQPGKVYWSDGGFISSLPHGRNPADFLIEFANTKSPEGIAFKKQLQKFVS